MTIPANVIWELNGLTGLDTNGGGFLPLVTGGVDKTYASPAIVSRTDMVSAGITAPAAPTVSASGTGGTVAVGTYSVVITYVAGTSGETLPSSASSVTVASGQKINVTSPPAILGATAFKVYISAVNTSTPLFLQNTAAGTQLLAAYSQSAAVSTATANPPGTDTSFVNITSVATPFATTDGGNLVQVPTGVPNWSAGFYCIVTFDSATATATFDRNPTTTAQTAGSGTLGGPLQTYAKLQASMVASNLAWIKASAIYSEGVQVTWSQTCSPSATVMPTRLYGYNTTRGDGGQPTIQLTTGSLSCILLSGNGYRLTNFILDANSKSLTYGVQSNGQYTFCYNITVKNYATQGIRMANPNCGVYFCEITAGTGSSSIGIFLNGNAYAYFCNVHDVVGSGIQGTNSNIIVENLIANCSGSSGYGITIGGGNFVYRNTIYNSGAANIYCNTSSWFPQIVQSNILHTAGSYNYIANLVPAIPANREMDGNVFYGATTGQFSNYGDSSGTVNASNTSVPYTNTHDIILTAGNDPFVNTATQNFNLNNNTNAGALLRGSGFPNSWLNNANTSTHPDMGASQTAATGTTNSFGIFGSSIFGPVKDLAYS